MIIECNKTPFINEIVVDSFFWISFVARQCCHRIRKIVANIEEHQTLGKKRLLWDVRNYMMNYWYIHFHFWTITTSSWRFFWNFHPRNRFKRNDGVVIETFSKVRFAASTKFEHKYYSMRTPPSCWSSRGPSAIFHRYRWQVERIVFAFTLE